MTDYPNNNLFDKFLWMSMFGHSNIVQKYIAHMFLIELDKNLNHNSNTLH